MYAIGFVSFFGWILNNLSGWPILDMEDMLGINKLWFVLWVVSLVYVPVRSLLGNNFKKVE
jgi:hypothetical protein